MIHLTVGLPSPKRHDDGRRLLGSCLLWSASIVALGCAPMPAVAPRPTVVTQPTPMFDRIKSFVGKWEFHAEKGSVIRVSYHLVSRGSVLVQSFFTASGNETILAWSFPSHEGTEPAASKWKR